MTFSALREAVPVVLVSTGTAAEVSARLAQAAPLLARQLGLVCLSPLELALAPDQALAALEQQAAGSALTWLGVDPGLALADGRPWAQALGAWRQPTLLLLEAAQLDTGTAAATTALLREQGAPLLGLIQWGEPWQPERRRLEGLPWLGALGPSGEIEGVDLRAALALQLQGAAAG